MLKEHCLSILFFFSTYVGNMTHNYTLCNIIHKYVGYWESKYRLRISLAHPRDCHFVHVQWLSLSIEKPQTPFREIRFMFMFVPVR